MGSPASASSGGGANVYIPTSRPAADSAFTGIVNAINADIGNSGATSPAGIAYPTAQDYVRTYLASINDPTQQAFLAGAGQGATGYGNLYPQIQSAVPGLVNAGSTGLGYAGQALGNAFNPAYGDIVSQLQNNPYYQSAIAGAQQGASLGAQGANGLTMAGQSLLSSGFDPQSALYNQQRGRALDTANVANAMSGTNNTPYGASVTANAVNNFDMNWQNNLLNRQATAANAASPLLQAAPGLAATSAGLPSGVYTNNLAQILSGLNAQNLAGAQGAAGYNTLVSGGGNALAGGNTLGLNLAQGITGTSGLPYTTGATIANNALAGLGSQVNLGNNQYSLPQQLLQDYESYLGLGQSAALAAGQLGNLGFNQTAQGLGGALSGANALFGNNGLLTGAGGLFGSGAGALTSGGAGGAFSAADIAAMDATGAAAGGGGLTSLLPFAAS